MNANPTEAFDVAPWEELQRRTLGVVSRICWALAAFTGVVVGGSFAFNVWAHGVGVALDRWDVLQGWLFTAAVPFLGAFGLWIRRHGPTRISFEENGFQIAFAGGRSEMISWGDLPRTTKLVLFSSDKGGERSRDHPPRDGRVVSYVDLGMLRMIALSDPACEGFLRAAKAHGIRFRSRRVNVSSASGTVYEVERTG